MADRRIEDLLHEAIRGTTEADDIDKLASELSSLLVEDKIKEEAEEKRGEAFARGFLKVMKQAGVNPKDAAKILSKVAQETAPETVPEAVLPTDENKEAVPNPLQGMSPSQSVSEEDLEQLVAQLGTETDPTKQTGQAQGQVKIEPEKQIAKKIVEIANGLISEGVPKDIAIEAAKAAVSAAETTVTEEVAKQKGEALQAAGTMTGEEAESIAQSIEDAVAALEAALTAPVEEALAAAPEELEEEEISPEEIMKAALYYPYWFYPWFY